jgi:short-subunit dehydrogenase
MNVFPGTTVSSFGENRLGTRGRQAHQVLPPVTAEKVARRVAQAVERNQRSVYISWFPDRAGLALNWLAGWAVSAVLGWWAHRAQT